MIRLENIFAYLYDPQNRLKKARKEASLWRAAFEFALYGLNVGVLTSVGVVVLMQDLNGGIGPGKAVWNAAHAIWEMGPVALIIIPLIGALTSIAAFFLVCGIILVMARFVGGKGTFTHNAFLVSKLIFPFSLVTLGIGFISQAPIIGTIIPIAWSLYALWIWVNVIHIANMIPLRMAALILALLVGAGGLLSSIV